MTEAEEQLMQRKRKTEVVVEEYIEKITKIEAKYKMVPSMEKKRSQSADRVQLTTSDFFS